MKNLCRATLAVSLASVSLLAHGTALAQAVPDNVDTDEQSGGVNVIVVTAQKRAQNLQDVPVSVSAFDRHPPAARFSRCSIWNG